MRHLQPTIRNYGHAGTILNSKFEQIIRTTFSKPDAKDIACAVRADAKKPWFKVMCIPTQ